MDPDFKKKLKYVIPIVTLALASVILFSIGYYFLSGFLFTIKGGLWMLLFYSLDQLRNEKKFSYYALLLNPGLVSVSIGVIAMTLNYEIIPAISAAILFISVLTSFVLLIISRFWRVNV